MTTLPTSLSTVAPGHYLQFASDNTLIDEFHAVFDATNSVRNLGEVAEAKFFLILETERTVIGTHDSEFVHA